MTCTNCGAEIKEGMNYCLECGASPEPVVISTIPKVAKVEKKAAIKEEKVYEGPFFSFSGCINSLKTDYTNIIALIGAFMVYLSPFTTWMWCKDSKNKYSASLFDLSGDSATIPQIGNNLFMVMGIIIIIVGFCMMLMSARENLRPLYTYKDNYIVRMLPIIIGIVVLIIVINNKAYKSMLEDLNRISKIGRNNGYNNDSGRGEGLILLISGMVVYGVSVVFDKNNKKGK